MNILCIEQFPMLGGGQRSLIDLLPAFSSRSWVPRVAVPGDGQFCEAVRRLGYETDDLECSRYSSIRKPARQVVKYAYELPHIASAITRTIQLRRIDILYVNGPRLLAAAAWAAMRKDVPLVFHCHNRLLQPSAIITAGAALRISRAWMIACCVHVRQPLRRFVIPGRLRLIYNGLSAHGAPSISLPNKLRRIGVIGRIDPEKGQMEFIQAARLVNLEFPDCRIFVVGAPMFSGGTYYERVAAASRGLPVVFSGWREDIPTVFSGLDLLVVPSTRIEATARVILEAYTAGVPVVAFPSGGIPEIVKDGETGFLCANFTYQSLAQRILSVLKMEPAKIHTVTSNAKHAWETHHTLDLFRQQVCNVIAAAL